MPSRKLESEDELEDFVRGCAFLGTGGGGAPEEGLKLLKREFGNGREIKWTDVSEIDDDAWTVSPFLMGSIAPKTREIKDKMKKLGLREPKYERKLIEALKMLEEYTGREIDVIVAVEIGGANTPGPLAAAANLHKIIVDGDYAGRAIPEIPQTTPYLKDKPMWPIASVDEWGDKTVIKEAINYEMAERIGKLISAAAFGLVGDAGFLMKGKDMKEVLIAGTLTEALEIGKKIREARETGEDPVQAVVDEIGGWLLFKGTVTEKEWEDKEGYYWGTHKLKGMGEFKDREFKCWFKNENHVSWIDGKPYVTSPDIFSAVNVETGEPKINPSITEGDKLAIIGMKGREQFKTVKGLEILGPKHFGFNIDYTPIEKIIV